MKHQRLRRRNGATIVVVAVSLPILLILVGFSVDLAYMQQVRSELNAVTDLAVKAASAELSDSGSSALATAKGKLVAAENSVGGAPLVLEDGDFVFGNSSRSFTSRWEFTAGAAPTNSLRLRGRRTAASPSGAVGLFFSGFIANKQFEPVAQATASFVDVDLCLVLDRSTSMKHDTTSAESSMLSTDPRFCQAPVDTSRWAALDRAVQLFVDRLNVSIAEEQVALVTFASDFTGCDSTSPAASLNQPLATDLSSITTAMSVLSAAVWNGNTEIDSGIALAHQELNSSRARLTSERIMVVLTDGVYTGPDPTSSAEAASADGITIHTITFGDFANQADMKTVALAGRGRHYHAPDESTLRDVFDEIAGSITILTD